MVGRTKVRGPRSEGLAAAPEEFGHDRDGHATRL